MKLNPFMRAASQWLILPSLVMTSSVLAEASETKKTEDDSTRMVIMASRVLPSADGLDSQELANMKASTSDTASLLKSVLGVNIQQGGGVSGLPVIRGMADDRLRIKVDGMDLISACGNHMNPPLSYIDPTNVSAATVFAGITPVSIGGDSIGSTIIVDSAKPEFAEQGKTLNKGQAGLSYRSNGDEFSANLGMLFATDNLSIRYNGVRAEAENYSAGDAFKAAGPAAAGRGDLAADEVGSSMYQSTNHALMFALQLDQHLWQLKYGKQDIPYQGWVNQRMDMTGNDSTQINLAYEGTFDWGLFEGRVYQEETRHSMQFYDDKLFWYGPNMTAPATDGIECVALTPGMNGCAAGMPMDTEGDNKGLSLKASIKFGEDDVIRVGADLQDYLLNDWWDPSGKGMWPNTFVNINDGERNRTALFSEWESKLNSEWQVQTGIRYEKVEMNADEVQGYSPMMAYYGPESMAFNMSERAKTDDNFDMTVLGRYQPDQNSSIEIGYARKSRSPNLYERYTWSTGGMVMRMINIAGDGNGYVGNLDLDAEVAHTVSAVFNYTIDDWTFTMSPHYSQVDNYIDATRCMSSNMNCGMMNQTATDAYVYLQFVNQSAKIYGLDAMARGLVADSTEWGEVNATVQLNYTRGENRDTGDNLYNMMPLNVTIAFDQKLNSWNNRLELEWVDAKDEVSDMRNELSTDSFALVNLRSNYDLSDNLQLNLGIENLMDKFYNHPLSGAYLGQGKTMSGTGVAWGTAVPGKGRSFYLALNASF